MTMDADLEDAALGGGQGLKRLYRRASLRQVSKEDLERARRNAGEVGRVGEELVNSHLIQLHGRGEIAEVEWTSQNNAVAPFDFRVRLPGGEVILIDAKTTNGEFDRPVHISLNELLQMANGTERYDIYRVYGASLTEARLRVTSDLRNLGREILVALATLPDGIVVDSVSVSPSALKFSPEVTLSMPDSDEAQS